MDRLARSARSARGEDRRGPCNCEEHSEDSLGEHKHPCDLPRRRRTKTRAPGQESRPAVPPRLHLLGSRVVGRRDPRPGQPRWRSVVGSVPTPIGRMSVSHGEGRGRVEPNGPTAHNDHTTSTRGRRLPIRRSHPGPIVRAGVVSLWALERHWRKPTPRGRADDPACRVQSGREETAPPPPRQSGLCGRDAPLIGQPNLGLWRSGKARVWIGCRRSASNDASASPQDLEAHRWALGGRVPRMPALGPGRWAADWDRVARLVPNRGRHVAARTMPQRSTDGLFRKAGRPGSRARTQRRSPGWASASWVEGTPGRH